ncbi:GerAB/ArcD/ProY family transporter [Brevibacillus fulvus]|uniref:Spore germination protein KB n=1 Tax=Brevibacillus fulvus TaxID=1125967 RepID=A0A938XZ09_9BACL|nr:GerAB/ArcD/ProY family transporter [Brevibacillus fulvus]MBM7588492.1 spore germination protein KB [Brevibacillus fulvus]
MKHLIEKISLWQLFTLIVNFELGSAIVVGIAPEAKQASWIATLVAGAFGLVFVFFYHGLIHLSGKEDLFQIMESLWGRAILVFFGSLYVMYFFYLAARVLRDFCELIVTAILPNTPIEVISITFMLMIGYLIYLGLEVVSRTSEIFSPYLLIFLIIIALMLVLTGRMEWVNLLPLLPEGVQPVLSALFPSLITFPFGELVVFTVVFGHVNFFRQSRVAAVMGILITTILLTISEMIKLAALGVDSKLRANFPLLSAVREISVANFIERIDALVVFIMMLGIIVKVSLYVFAGLKGLEAITRLQYRSFVVPVCMLITFFSIISAENYAEHIKEGLELVPLLLHIPFQIVVPGFVLLFLLWRKWKTARS